MFDYNIGHYVSYSPKMSRLESSLLEDIASFFEIFIERWNETNLVRQAYRKENVPSRCI